MPTTAPSAAAAPVAVRLGPAVAHPPRGPADRAWSTGPALDRFTRCGGAPGPVTPTAACLLWDADALYVRFICGEPNPLYRPLRRDDFDEGLGRPQFADMVAVLLRPRWGSDACILAAAASAGDVTARRIGGSDDTPSDEVPGVTAVVARGRGTWSAVLRIPWASLGGVPDAPFGLNLLRTRWQSGERLSASPLDFWDEPAPDLCLRATLGGVPDVTWTPPGAHPVEPLRWRPPVAFIPPTAALRAELHALQRELAQPTTAAVLPRRIRLAQAWTDLLVCEGFSFHPQGGSWELRPGEFGPAAARRAVNDALDRGAGAEACRVLDVYLAQLDRATRAWFADGTPGNLDHSAWTALTAVRALRRTGTQVRLSARAGRHPVHLTLAFPADGGARLHGNVTGAFAPPRCRRPHCRATPEGWRLTVPGLAVTVTRTGAVTVADSRNRRRLEVPPGGTAFRFAATGEVLAVDLQLVLRPDERLLGFGERFDAMNHRGRVLTVHDLDAWEGLFYTLPNHMYKPVALCHSSAGYTLFSNATGLLRVDAGHRDPNRLRLTTHGPVLDLFAWPAPPCAALRAYTALTGRPLQPPDWAFAPWFGGGWERWKKGPCADPAREIRTVAERFARLDIPHAAVYAEGVAMDDPRTTAWLEPLAIRVLSWMNSTVGIEEQRKLLPGLADANLPILRRADGTPFPYIDFTHPNAMRLVRAFWRHRLDIGVAGSMVDFGDLVPADARCHDGRRGVEMHNFYACDYHRTFAAAFRERRGADHVLFSRSAAPGSQRWLCQFAGDHQANFTGLANALRGGLNLAACGFSTWGCDIGGYLAWPDPEVYIRWVQWGCFSPLMRCHGTRPREPWEYGPLALRVYRFHAWVRQALGPYLHAAAAEASRTGTPLMRALPLAFPDWPPGWVCDDAYLLGPDLLVAPVLAPGHRRTVPFPPGTWTCLWTGRTFAGGHVASVPAPLSRIPVFLRAGALLPVRLNPALTWGASLSHGAVDALVVTPCARAEKRLWREASVEIDPLADGFQLTLRGMADTRTIIVAGCAVRGAHLDGVELPQVDDAAAAAARPGARWRERARTVVRLPHAQARVLRIAL